MILKKDGQPLMLAHGTNRNFKKHSIWKSRTELNERFQGDWICYSPSDDVAWKYAKAARNQCIDKHSFEKETINYLDKNFKDKDFNDFIMASFTTLMKVPYEDAWDIIYEDYAKKYKTPIEQTPKYFFDKIRQYENENPQFEFNDFCDVLEHVEYSKTGQTNDELESISNFLNSRINEIPHFVIEFLKERGYKDSIPETKIIKSHISANKILETDNREEAANAKKKGYDLVIYSGPDCVDNVPEYLVAHDSQVKIKEIIIAHTKTEYLDENKSSWCDEISYERIEIKDEKTQNKRKLRR